MWIEVFKTGNHTDSNGNSVEYGLDDLSQIAENYNNSLDKDTSSIAPIVKGHPKTNDPAYGWVERLKVNGNKLLAKIKDIVPEFAEEVQAGRYRKVSIALYPNSMLRHIGFLGAMAPAVKGLKPVAFSDETDYVEFSFEAGNKEIEIQIELLKKENRQLKQKINSLESEKKNGEFEEFAEGLVLDNKISPHQAEALKTILIRLTDFQEYSEEEPLTDLIKEFASNITTMSGLTSEFAQDTIEEPEDQFEGKNTSPERLAIHKLATNISRSNHNLTYEQALLQALNQ